MVAVTTTSKRCATKPDTSHGAPVGVRDWRLTVERLNGSGSIVGACVVGSPSTSPVGNAVVGTLQWEDMTGFVRGLEWVRGAEEPYGRPRVGEAAVTLDNSGGDFTPWIGEYADTRPGTVWRAGLVSATDVRAGGWVPQWTMVVDEWMPQFETVRKKSTTVDADAFADAFVEVRLVESLSRLARIDDNSVAVQGSGDSGYNRIDRLLSAASWKFGLVDLGGGATDPTLTLQSTDMAANRLSECYLTADSSRRRFRSDVTGAAAVTPGLRWSSAIVSRLGDFSSITGTPWIRFSPTDAVAAGLAAVAFDADSIQIASTPEHIVNDHRYARVGGTQQVVENSVSVGRFDRSTRARTDLICSTDANSLAVATDDNTIEARTSLRCDGVVVTIVDRGDVSLVVAAVDVGNMASVVLRENDVYLTGPVRTVTHSVTPLPGRTHWTATFAVDVSSLVGFPDGSMLE